MQPRFHYLRSASWPALLGSWLAASGCADPLPCATGEATDAQQAGPDGLVCYAPEEVTGTAASGSGGGAAVGTTASGTTVGVTGSGGGGGAGGGDTAGEGGAGGSVALPGPQCPTRNGQVATRVDGLCCYPDPGDGMGSYGGSEPNCGRPFLVDGAPLTSSAVTDATWRSAAAAPEEGDRSPRAAAFWTRCGLMEHASIASFARFALELLAVGAPPELVRGAHEAALDEVEHARRCFALASRFAGEEVGPGPLDIPAELPIDRDLAALARRAFREGCLGESTAAVLALEQRAAATDLEVQGTLDLIVGDESRHAALAWRFVRWAVAAGGAPVRAAISAEADSLERPEPMAPSSDEPGDAARGVLPQAIERALGRHAAMSVVLPLARQLLAAAGTAEVRQ